MISKVVVLFIFILSTLEGSYPHINETYLAVFLIW